MSDLLVDELLDYHVMTSSPGSTNFMKNLLSKHDCVEGKVDMSKRNLIVQMPKELVKRELELL